MTFFYDLRLDIFLQYRNDETFDTALITYLLTMSEIPGNYFDHSYRSINLF